MFQQIYRYSKIIGNTDHISVWKSKGFSGKSIKPPANYDSLAPSLNQIDFRTRIKFDGQCFKQDKLTFIHKVVVGFYILYEINLWPFKQSADFTLGNSLFGLIKLTKKG